MFAIEEDLDKKLWLYAIHLGKDRSEVVNDLLRPIVASMVLYDSRDRRGGRNAEPALDRGVEAERRDGGLISSHASRYARGRGDGCARRRIHSSGPRVRPGRGARACSSSGPGRGSRP